jgi:hypothetical protein
VSTKLQIARDLHKIFETEEKALPTSQLVKLLIRTSPEHWSNSSYYGKDLTAQRLGRILTGAFGIYSERLTESVRGYRSNQFETIWSRLGITPNKPTKPTYPTEPLVFDDPDLF